MSTCYCSRRVAPMMFQQSGIPAYGFRIWGASVTGALSAIRIPTLMDALFSQIWEKCSVEVPALIRWFGRADTGMTGTSLLLSRATSRGYQTVLNLYRRIEDWHG